MLNQTTEYIYDNWQVIEERSGANVKSFVYGDYIDEVVYIENSGVRYYPLRGVNFNIEALTNSSGDLIETYAIDAFGNFKVFDADGVEKVISDRLNSIVYQGREYDDEVRMYYFRNRWYSAELGRFISRDPLRYGAGDVNLYRFVGNDPVNGLDPMGLSSKSDIDAGMLIYSCRCGWIDWGHANRTNALGLWNQIKNNQGKEIAGSYDKKVDHQMEQGKFGISVGVSDTYWYKGGLSDYDKKSVALAIFQDVSYRFEQYQANMPFDFLGNSSGFSEEDLTSNIIGFYKAIDNFDNSKVKIL